MQYNLKGQELHMGIRKLFRRGKDGSDNKNSSGDKNDRKRNFIEDGVSAKKSSGSGSLLAPSSGDVLQQDAAVKRPVSRRPPPETR